MTGTFTGLPRLEIINLSNNDIEVLPAGTINLETSLNYVYLHHNNITSIAEGALIGRLWSPYNYEELINLFRYFAMRFYFKNVQDVSNFSNATAIYFIM